METTQTKQATQATGKLGALKSNVENMVHIGKESFADAEKLALDALGDVSEKITKAVKDTRNFIRENPGTTVAVVLVAGFVLAKLLNKSKNDDIKIH